MAVVSEESRRLSKNGVRKEGEIWLIFPLEREPWIQKELINHVRRSKIVGFTEMLIGPKKRVKKSTKSFDPKNERKNRTR